MKNLFKYFVFAFLMFYSLDSYSGPTYPGGPADPRDAINQYGDLISDPSNPLPKLEVENTTYFKLCEIRRFFCGKIKVVMVACAVFIVGLLIIIGKISWMSVIAIIGGIAIFSGAEYVAITVTTLPPNLGVIYSCYCFSEPG